MFLTESELQTLSGKVKPSAQMRWLKAEKIAYITGGDGKPKVLRDLVVARLGGTGQTRPEPQLRLAS